ncbi:hypothetical protein PSTT_01045 [Puccinia striiformis]|uniref:Uncharacterized protein n=1 Tax=Puccinia striiformis TaxID=27350 RepID=A0A2S4W530_9BASI|nr:hypothetical protein PSTT_01045 [Puccinia striiformis]
MVQPSVPGSWPVDARVGSCVRLPLEFFLLAGATRLIRSEILHQFSVRSDTSSRQCHCLHEETTGNDPLGVHAGPAWKSPRISVGSTVKYARGVHT